MIPGKYDLKMYRGDDHTWRFRLWQDASQTLPVDLTGATVAAEIREKSAGVAIVELIVVVTPLNIVDVSMTPAMYVNCPSKGVWDLQVTFADGKIHTPVAGAVSVIADVTDSVVMPMAARAR